MGIFNYFRSGAAPRQSAKLAKERLQIIVARERVARSGPDYLPDLHRDLLEVIRRYVPIDDEAVQVRVDNDGRCDVLELNVALPDPAERSAIK
ncbi:MAG: cell division topological specificity factor MinE [Thioalkalivibrionaceae bacterium]